MEITTETAKKLIKDQFPQWQELPIRPVAKSGHDNRTFHLGDTMTVRLPSGEDYAPQAAKENQWLPYLQKHLDYPISCPLAVGKPASYYPFPWSVNLWIEGETLLQCPDIPKEKLAQDLSAALKKLQAVDCHNGPRAGLHNFYRGGDLTVYHQQTMDALEHLRSRLPTPRLSALWQQCIAVPYSGKNVWVHGDIAPGNILIKDRRFWGLIDFGILGAGDPSCDYAMAWTYFDGPSRTAFLKGLSDDMISRAMGWALWKALITYDDENPDVKNNARYTVETILKEA